MPPGKDAPKELKAHADDGDDDGTTTRDKDLTVAGTIFTIKLELKESIDLPEVWRGPPLLAEDADKDGED